METTENNKLIAEFDQKYSIGFGLYDFDGCHYELDKLEFHKSWDWLMPVVEKIEDYDEYDVEILQYGTRVLKNSVEIITNVADFSFDKKIEHCYDAIIKFIKEYNKQN